MNRVKTHLGLLIILIMGQWILTAFFFSRLPGSIPLNFPEVGYPTLVPRMVFFVFPVVSTVLAGIALAVYPLRRKLPVPGKKLLAPLPAELSNIVFDRAWQILAITIVFLVMVSAFYQANISVFATGFAAGFKLWPIFMASGVMVLYVVFSIFMLRKTVDGVIRYHEDQQKEMAAEAKKEETDTTEGTGNTEEK